MLSVASKGPCGVGGNEYPIICYTKEEVTDINTFYLDDTHKRYSICATFSFSQVLLETNKCFVEIQNALCVLLSLIRVECISSS